MSNISAKNQQGNNWSIYLGLVLEDKDSGSKDIKVHLEELIPFVEGEVNPKKMELQVSSDYSEKTYSGTVEASNFVTATYLGTESNRRYPPDVRKNEQVFVLNYSDQDKYFWISSGRDEEWNGITFLFQICQVLQLISSLMIIHTFLNLIPDTINE